MRKTLRRLGAIVGGLVLLVVVSFAVARMRGPTEAQQAALALLEERPHAGRNAFALLWLLPYDVPEAERERVLAEDVRRFRQVPHLGFTTARFKSSAAERFPAHSADRGIYCQWRDRECLAKVRANPDAYAALIERDAALLARADSLAEYGHVRSPLPARIDMPFPSYYLLSYPLTRHAHAFASGDIDAGLDGTCRGVLAARMLMRDGNDVMGTMIGTVMLEGNAALFADMLAELPAERPLPRACGHAFAPVHPLGFGLCPAIRGEARRIFAQMRATNADPAASWAWPVMFDADQTVARMAEGLAWHCGKSPALDFLLDKPVRSPLTNPERTFDCVGNLAGCTLSDIATPAIDPYHHRLQDAGMRLKLVQTLLWLRDRPAGQPVAERLAQQPRDPPRRAQRLSADGTSLTMDLFHTQYGDTWSLPLPASRMK